MSEIEKYYNGEIHVDFDDEKEELNNSITWWSNRFNAVERDNKELRKIINGMIENEEKYCLEINRLNNIINELEKSLKNLKGYYDQINFNTRTEFDDEEQVNRFWQEYGESKVVYYYFDKLQELKGSDKE